MDWLPEWLPVPGLLPLAIGAYIWAQLLVKKASGRTPLRFLLPVIIVVPLLCLFFTVLGLRKSFSVMEVDASQKAQVLSEGISLAMNATGIAYGLLVAILLLLAIVSIRRWWSRPSR